MNDSGKTKLEVLKMARELLNEEYINRRAEDHNKWLSECDVVWKNQGIKLPYPAFAPYPSEAEILARATALYSFVAVAEPTKEPAVDTVIPESVSESTQPATPLAVPQQPTEPAPVPEVAAAATAPDLRTELDKLTEQVQPKPLFASKPMPPADLATSSALKNLLPSWLQARDNNV